MQRFKLICSRLFDGLQLVGGLIGKRVNCILFYSCFILFYLILEAALCSPSLNKIVT